MKKGPARCLSFVGENEGNLCLHVSLPTSKRMALFLLSKALILHTIYREIYTRIGVKQNRGEQVTDPSGKRTFVLQSLFLL